MSFYRIYRPQVISEIDNEAVRKQLTALLGKKRSELPHAYLFTGPRGAGKTTAARLVAKLFNCTKPTKTGEPASTRSSNRGEPCGKCDQCLSIANGTNIDVLEMDGASNRGIDEIRELRDRIHLSPAVAVYKVYIIDEVHMLTTEAFNALLKTLEEPPAHAVFVLATTDPQKIPVTVQSRCMGISFAKAGTGEIAHALSRIVAAEKITITDEAMELIASHTDGSFRDAVKTLEQVSFIKGKISPGDVRAVLSIVDEESLALFIDALNKKNIHEALGAIEGAMTKGYDIKMFMTQVLKKLETLLVSTAKGNITPGWTLKGIQSLIRLFTKAFGDMKYATIVQLPFEAAVIEYCVEEIHPLHSRGEGTPTSGVNENVQSESFGLISLEKLTEHWKDVIEEVKPFNHSISGVLRSTRPASVENGIVMIEAFYPFHKERLCEVKSKEIISNVLKKLFGEQVKVEIMLGKK